MLLGEQLGGRHQRGLAAHRRDLQRRRERDRGLARADVALQQPVHRRVAGEVDRELVDRAALRAGGHERQRARQALGHVGRARARDRAVTAAGSPTQRHGDAEDEQLAPRQPPLPARGAGVERVDVGVGQLGGRRVEQPDGVAQRAQLAPRQHRGRDAVVEVRGGALDRAQARAAQPRRRDAGDVGMARQDPRAGFELTADAEHVGVGHLGGVAADLQHARQRDLGAHREALLEAAPDVEPADHQRARARRLGIDEAHVGPAAPARPDHPHRDHPGPQRDALAGDGGAQRGAQRRDPPRVVVAARQQPEQILDGGDAALGEPLGHRRAHALEHGDRRDQRIVEVGRRRRRRHRARGGDLARLDRAGQALDQAQAARDLDALGVARRAVEATQAAAPRDQRLDRIGRGQLDHAVAGRAQRVADAGDLVEAGEAVGRRQQQRAPQRLEASIELTHRTDLPHLLVLVSRARARARARVRSTGSVREAADGGTGSRGLASRR